jgi:hypothetical protein
MSTVMTIPAVAQNYAELGVMSGTGVVFMPTSSVSPNAQFRVDGSRIGLFQQGGHGLNLISISSGLSRFVEAYLNFTNEQSGYAQSTTAMNIGGKFTLPVIVPLIKLVSLWGEFATSQSEDHSQLYPLKYSRAAIIVTPFTNGIRPSILIGTAKPQNTGGDLMTGGSLVVSPNHTTQLGIEYLHGYAGDGTNDITLNGNVRLFSNISLHAGPGYVSRPTVSGWIWTIGLSLSSSDVDFHPVIVEHKSEYRLPSIEEIEKESSGDKKDSNGENKQ